MNTNEFIEYQLDVEDVRFTFFTNHFIQTDCDSKNDSPNIHAHQYNELFYVIDGSIVLNTETESCKLNKNDLAVVPANTHHFVSCDETPYYVVIGFSVTKINNAKETIADRFLCLTKKNSITLIRDFDEYDCFKRLLIYQNNFFSDNLHLIKACLYEIMFLLKNRFFEKTFVNDVKVNMNSLGYRDYTIDLYMASNYSTASLDELSRLVHLSKQQLQRVIKKLYNQSYSERILTLKLLNSKKLLKNTHKSIAEIASILGYNSPHGFFSAFKKAYGITPNEYRKQEMQKTEND